MACFRTYRKTYNSHHSIKSAVFHLSDRHNASAVKKRYDPKPHRRRRYMKEFENLDEPRKGKLALNEYGEYITKYGDWLHNAKQSVALRDERIWEEEFRKIRKKYKQEYAEKFRQRLAEFTRIADAKMYDLSLQSAQKKERKRLSNIRINALKAANKGTKARQRMELKRRNDIIAYDARDSKRDVIREMVWEKPEKNWIIKENFTEKLSLQLMDKLMDDSQVENDEYIDFNYYGLPGNGYYDTMEGLFRHSDKYFADCMDTKAAMSSAQTVTAISKQPISWYIRKTDNKDEYVHEIHESQQLLNKHLKRNTHNNKKKTLRKGKQSINDGKQQDIEYEVDQKNIVPNYWFNIDWNAQFEKRDKNLDKSPIFMANQLILKYELDKYEDIKLLLNKKYYDLLRECESMNKLQIVTCLKEIFAAFIPAEILHKYDDIESKEEFLDVIIEDIVLKDDAETESESDDKRWFLYKEFTKRMKHFGSMHWKSAKINFDSEIRRWRMDFLKWRYLIFNDNKQHIEWRQRLRKTDLSNSDINLCKKAVVRLQQLEHLILARRTGANILENLINNLEDDVLKIFYIWFEELTENGEEICMGKGWSFNRYEEQQMLPHVKAKQIPIEYFRLPITNLVDNSKTLQKEQMFVHKSH